MKKVSIIIGISVFCLCGLGLYQSLTFNDGKLHVVFCKVGQGDAVLVTTPKNQHLLFDGGPDSSVLDCLSRHMPFWERTFALVLLSHPHADHFTGFFSVFERYTIDSFATEKLRNNTPDFTQIMSLLKQKAIPSKQVSAGDMWRFFDGTTVTVLAPTKQFLLESDPNGQITDSATSASVVTEIRYGSFSLVITGDAPRSEMLLLATRAPSVAVLQIPHHGSTTGIDSSVLEAIHPQFAVISVGKNTYGHPKKQVLDLLQKNQIPFLRTDMHGDIEIVSDGTKLGTFVK